MLGVVKQRKELVEQALLAFLGELPVEAVHAAPEHGAEIVQVLLGGDPIFFSRQEVLVACLIVEVL